ncbi:hypothetical protein ACEOVB_29580 [Pseudomonas aeruginosa]
MGTLRKTLKGLMWAVMLLIVMPVGTTYLLQPYTNAWLMSWEMNSTGYAIVAKEYVTLSPHGREEVRKLLNKGYLRKSDMGRVFDVALPEKPAGEGIQTFPAPDYGDESEDFDAEMWRNIRGKPTVSKAKDKLLQMVAQDMAIGRAGINSSAPAAP